MRTNLEAPAFLAHALHQANPKGPANIINILDFKVGNLNPDYLSYTTAKVCLAGLTRMLAIAFHGRIRVNAIAPGLTMRSGRQTEAQFERAWRMTPLGRGPEIHEITAAARFILDTASLNGQIIFLDGGAALRPRARDISVDPEALLAAEQQSQPPQ
jgi:NAD(P)-dependent dehydrogenase (short-subunit alcohol dehydrogenase family)